MKRPVKSGLIVAYKNTQVFFTWQVKNKLLKACLLWMKDSRIYENMKIARDDSAVKLGVTDVAFHSTHRKELYAVSYWLEGRPM